YIRLKKENWRKLQDRWLSEVNSSSKIVQESESEPKKSKWLPFNRNQQTAEQHTNLNNPPLPNTEAQLKQYFLNQLYPIQLKWATSTISHESFTKVSLRDKETLKYFLQRFPDIYFLMYHPVFNIMKSPVVVHIILISPFAIEVISFIDEHAETTIVATKDRKWKSESETYPQSTLSPVISVKRKGQNLKSLVQTINIEIPIQKSIISYNNHILYTTEPDQTKIIGKQDYPKWFEQKRALTSTLKSVQLKAMQALLSHCQTNAVRRPEWNDEQQNSYYNDQEEL